jgi:hypothetical protein
VITHDALVVARRVYRLAMTADHCARDGDEARARVLLSELASVFPNWPPSRRPSFPSSTSSLQPKRRA